MTDPVTPAKETLLQEIEQAYEKVTAELLAAGHKFEDVVEGLFNHHEYVKTHPVVATPPEKPADSNPEQSPNDAPEAPTDTPTSSDSASGADEVGEQESSGTPAA